MNPAVLLFLILALSASWAVAGDFTPVLFGGDVRSLAVDPETPERVLLGTADGQIFVSGDFGSSWSKVLPGLQRRNLVIDNLLFDPVDPEVVYAATWELKDSGGALFKSRDSGATWEELPLGRHNSTIRAIAVAPGNNQVIALGISEGVILSQDGGKTWKRINRGYRSLYNAHSLAFDPKDSSTLYVGTWRLAWKTMDLGESWQPIHKGMFWDSDLFTILIDPRDSSRVYASACSGIYKSGNGGELWRKLHGGLPEEAKRTRTLRFDPTNPDRLYAGTTVGLYRSTDGGDQWLRLLEDVTVNTIAVHPSDPRRILIGTDDAGVFLSRDNGHTFGASNSGFHQRQVTALRSGFGDHLLAVVAGDGRHGGVLMSVDGGRDWKAANEGLPNANTTIAELLVSGRRPEAFVATPRQLFQGSPGTEPWQPIHLATGLSINGLAFAESSETHLLIAANEGLFLFDPDETALRRIEFEVYDRAFLAAHRDPVSGRLFVGTEMGVFRSDDEGKTWTIRVEGLPYLTVKRFFQAGSRVFAASGTQTFYTDDSGDNWSESQGLPPLEIVSLSHAPGSKILFASDATIGYLFTSPDNGTTWTARDVYLEASLITALLASDGQLLLATQSEGILRLAHARQALSTDPH